MSRNPRFLLFILVFFAINLLLLNHSISLWDEDEAAYAGFAQHILETGNWVIPEFEWSSIHRKTPFHFWTIAVSYMVFGVNEFALRFPSCLSVFLTCFFLYYWGANVFGAARSRLAAIVLASSTFLPFMGKVALTDAHLLLFQTLAVLALFNYLANPNWKWNLGFWLSISLGILTKGPPILILTAGLWIWLAIFHPKSKRLIGTHPWIFGPLALVPTVYWGYLTYQQDGGAFLRFLYDWYIHQRIAGNIYNQTGPPGYHLLVLVLAFLTWLPFVLTSIGEVFRKFWKRAERKNESILIGGWLVFAWLFYELMTSKLPSYSLAAQPALALLIAQQTIAFEEGSAPKHPKLFWSSFYIYLSILFSLLIGIPLLTFAYLENEALVYALGFSVLLGGVLFKTIPLVCRQHRLAVVHLAILGMTFSLCISIGILSIIEKTPVKQLKTVAKVAHQYQKTFNNPKEVPLYLTGFGAKQTKVSLLVYLSKHFKHRSNISLSEAAEKYKNKAAGIIILAHSGYVQFKRACSHLGIGEEHWKEKGTRVLWWSMDDKLAAHPFWIICRQCSDEHPAPE